MLQLHISRRREGVGGGAEGRFGSTEHISRRCEGVDEVHNMSHEGAEALAEALKDISALQKIDLCGNNISGEGAESLAEALKVNSALQKLALYRLKGNPALFRYILNAIL